MKLKVNLLKYSVITPNTHSKLHYNHNSQVAGTTQVSINTCTHTAKVIKYILP